jgi:hypothetical protein
MGAHSITEIAPDNPDTQDAFRQLKEAARSEYGSDPYNGSISTIASFRRSPLYQEPIPESCLDWVDPQIWNHQHEGRLPEIQKWESCLALPLAADDQFSWTEETVEIEVSSDHRSYPSYPIHTALRQLLGPDSLVGDVSWEPVDIESQPSLEESAAVDFDPGYAVLFKRREIIGPIFPTREEAIERARVIAMEKKDGLDVVEIKPAYYSCERKAAVDTYAVTYRQPQPKGNPEIKGWAFIGLAAS